MSEKRILGKLGIAMLIAGICCIAIGTGLALFFSMEQPQTPTTEPSSQIASLPTEKPTVPTTLPPEKPPVVKVSTATVGSTGDILMHKKVIQSGYDPASDTYNYDSVFAHFSRFVSQVDYAVANLEVTLCGTDNGYVYAGYPYFNSPDAIVDALKNAGFDMLLTANNHSYDTGYKGFIRTQQVVADRGLAHIGTRLTAEEKNYSVQEINGIRVGMICYTYNTGVDEMGNVSLNTMPLNGEASRLVNSFSYARLSDFYDKLSGELAQMRADGADATMLYIHWGEEYQTRENSIQRQMAQALCDLGIDVIVGNHAHVAQPIELLTNSTDDSKKTLCLYSMGNSLSNIRQSSTHPANCEDGLLFSVTFAKYSDGTMLLESADVLPTWVNRYQANGVSKFCILTMDGQNPEKWQADMELTEELVKKCQASYERTMKILGSGLTESNAYFAQNQAKTEENLNSDK